MGRVKLFTPSECHGTLIRYTALCMNQGTIRSYNLEPRWVSLKTSRFEPPRDLFDRDFPFKRRLTIRAQTFN